MTLRSALFLSFVLLLSLDGCGDGDATSTTRATGTPSAPASGSTSEPPLFDAEGRLLASDVVVDGLAIPRGFTLVLERPGHRVYQSGRVPIEALESYLRGRVEARERAALGPGFVFRGARALDATPDARRFDATAMYVGPSLVRLDLEVLVPAAPIPGSTDAERVRAAERMLRERAE